MFEYELILSLIPLPLIDIGITMVVPSFTALLAYSSRKACCNERPPLRTMLRNKIEEKLVLVLGPWLLCHTRLKHFVPSFRALSWSTRSGHFLDNCLPVLDAHAEHNAAQCRIFFASPRYFRLRL